PSGPRSTVSRAIGFFAAFITHALSIMASLVLKLRLDWPSGIVWRIPTIRATTVAFTDQLAVEGPARRRWLWEPCSLAAVHCSRTSGRQAPFKALGAKRPWLGDQSSGGVHLLPDVPQQHAPHPAIPQVVDHPLPVRLLPVGYGLKPGVHLAYGLVAQLEQVRVEEREVVVGDGSTGHRLARQPTHCVGVILVLHAESLVQGRVVEVGYVSGGVDVRVAGAQGCIDANPVLHL